MEDVGTSEEVHYKFHNEDYLIYCLVPVAMPQGLYE